MGRLEIDVRTDRLGDTEGINGTFNCYYFCIFFHGVVSVASVASDMAAWRIRIFVSKLANGLVD